VGDLASIPVARLSFQASDSQPAMVYKFDPTYWNGTIFHLDENMWKMSGNWNEYRPRNLPIPASCFPQTLIFDRARAALPDMFNTSRNIIVFSERARVIMEHWAPGQVEFIPVACQAEPKIAARLNFASAYYFINVLARAQRLQWLEMPTHKYSPRDDGTELLDCCRTSAYGSCEGAPPGSH